MVPYIEALQKAIDYIEDNLNEEIDLLNVAKKAGYSFYHFQRVFHSVVGDSVKDYIRKRRMTEAAKELVQTQQAVVDIGVKYGYESREAFSRAFAKVYGRSPSEIRNDGLLYTIREPMSIDYLMFEYNRRHQGMQPIFRRLPERVVVGERYPLVADGSNLKDIPLLWAQWDQKRRGESIKERKYANERMGICIFSDTDQFDYMIAYEVEAVHNIPEGMESFRLESSLYAVFKAIGPITESVQKTWDYIYSIWLIESDYNHAYTHDIEYYYFYHGELTADLYVPIIPKALLF